MTNLEFRFSVAGIDKTSSLFGGLAQTIDNVVGKLGKANAEMVTVAGQARRIVITGASSPSSVSPEGNEPGIIEPATKGLYKASRNLADPASVEKLKKDLQGIQENILEGLFPPSVLKNLTFGINPLFNPTSVWGNLFALRQNFSALASKDGGPLQEKILGGVGLGRLSGTTGGAAAATGVLMAGLLAVGLSLKALTEIIRRTSQTFQDAHKLYSQALQSGMSLRLTSQMNAVGNVLGVDPSHAMAFSGSGEAQKQTQYASGIIANTAPVLAEVIMQFRILSLTLKAVFSVLGEKVAPPIRQMIDAFNKAAKMLLDSGLAEVIGAVAAQFLYLVNVIIKVASTLYGILTLAFAGITELFVNIKRLVTGEGVDFTRTLASLASLQSLFDTPNEIADNKLGMARQLPASAWEKMGLVVGGIGGGTDYAKRTANATERTANYLSSIVALPRGTTSGINPAYPAP